MFYDNFIALCKKKNVKPTPLVTSMGLSSSNVSQWKDGSIPRADVLLKISNYFGVSMEYMLSGEKEKPADGKSSGLSEEMMEIVNLYDSATPELQAAALAMLRAAEAARSAPGAAQAGA